MREPAEQINRVTLHVTRHCSALGSVLTNMATTLDQLKKFTTVVADSGDFESKTKTCFLVRKIVLSV